MYVKNNNKRVLICLSCEASLEEISIIDISIDDLNNRLEYLKEEYERLAVQKESQMQAEDKSFEVLRCPITVSAFINPVILPVDGVSFEYSALLSYIDHAEQIGKDLKSPINSKPFTKSDITPNRGLAQLLRNDFPILREVDDIQDELKRRHRESSAQESHSAMPLDIDGQDDVPQEVGAQAATTESDAVDILGYLLHQYHLNILLFLGLILMKHPKLILIA